MSQIIRPVKKIYTQSSNVKWGEGYYGTYCALGTNIIITLKYIFYILQCILWFEKCNVPIYIQFLIRL